MKFPVYITLALSAAVSISLFTTDAHAVVLTAPQNVVLRELQCVPEATPSAHLTWAEQEGATSYKVYARPENEPFRDAVATTSAEFEINLKPKEKTIIAVSALNEPTGTPTKPPVAETEKSEEFVIDTPKLCDTVLPTNPTKPLEREIVLPKLSVTEAQRQAIEEQKEVSPTEEVSPTPIENVLTAEQIEKLDRKYENSRKTQARIEKKVQGVINWVKTKIFFFI